MIQNVLKYIHEYLVIHENSKLKIPRQKFQLNFHIQQDLHLIKYILLQVPHQRSQNKCL